MYSLRLSVRGAEGFCPVKPVELSATNDDQAIKLGRAQSARLKASRSFLTSVSDLPSVRRMIDIAH
jgi:hypothetical protein